MSREETLELFTAFEAAYGPLAPKLSPEVTKASIDAISAESVVLRAAVESARPARAKLQLLDRVLTAVTRSAAIELAQLKRLLKANGFTEADAHTMIPDRSSAPAKKEAATPDEGDG